MAELKYSTSVILRILLWIKRELNEFATPSSIHYLCKPYISMKKTLIPGASPNPDRFSNKMVKSLIRHGYEAVPLGLRKGDISGIEIITGKPEIKDIHTISLYIGAARQVDYYDYLLGLMPKRIIFNPGTYNYELIELAEKKNIECVVSCALIMLSNGTY